MLYHPFGVPDFDMRRRTRMEYIVQYGRTALLGRFRASHELALNRDEQVIVHTNRGREIGCVMSTVRTGFAHLVDATLSGEIEDRFVEELLPQPSLDEAISLAFGLPIEIIDAEPLLDGTVILHVLKFAECDLSPFLATLSGKWDRRVMLYDITNSATDPIEMKGCGKPGCGTSSGGCGSCGTTKGGCSTGSCSSGKVKNAEELTDYFANLRKQMEDQNARVPLN